jgi:hypothetical protein
MGQEYGQARHDALITKANLENGFGITTEHAMTRRRHRPITTSPTFNLLAHRQFAVAHERLHVANTVFRGYAPEGYRVLPPRGGRTARSRILSVIRAIYAPLRRANFANPSPSDNETRSSLPMPDSGARRLLNCTEFLFVTAFERFDADEKPD